VLQVLPGERGVGVSGVGIGFAPSERTSRRGSASFSSPVGACSSASRCGQSVGDQREGIDYYALGERWETDTTLAAIKLRRRWGAQDFISRLGLSPEYGSL
jgi:hypothetical protein